MCFTASNDHKQEVKRRPKTEKECESRVRERESERVRVRVSESMESALRWRTGFDPEYGDSKSVTENVDFDVLLTVFMFCGLL